jgi:aminoglycoside 3-N-acetyltransferase
MNRDYHTIKDDLKALGLKNGDAVMIHSSFKAMGQVEGGIETFVNALLSVIGDTGTLVSPTLTFSHVTMENRVFDYVNTPSCVGAISEYIRHIDGAKRSIHPTHSCAVVGAKRDFYVNGHENDRTPIGKNSPIYKLHEDGGKVLMLGCGIACNTSMHGVEEYLPTSYVLPKEPTPYTIVLEDKTYDIDFYRHHIKQHGYMTRFERLYDIIDHKFMPKGIVHGAESYLIDAPEMWRVGIEALKKDEFFFVDKLQ